MKNEFKYGDTQYWLQKYILITVLLLNFDLICLLNLLGLSCCDAGCFGVVMQGPTVVVSIMMLMHDRK